MEQKVSYNEAFRLFFHDEEYSYALELGCIIAPEYDNNEETDQLEFNGCYKAFDAFRRIINSGADIPFTYKEYLAEEDIQNGLKALAVDSLKFWNALVLLHHISDDKFNGSHSILPSAYDEVSEFIQYLDSEDSTIIARKKNGRKAEITDPEIIKSIRRYLEENIDEADYLSRCLWHESDEFLIDGTRLHHSIETASRDDESKIFYVVSNLLPSEFIRALVHLYHIVLDSVIVELLTIESACCTQKR